MPFPKKYGINLACNAIHIIALNIPYPPNYGGIIDIYYQLVALKKLKVGVILHCFEYERCRAKELETVCTEIHYYKRNTGLRSNLTLLPYNVYSRRNPELLTNLLKNNDPILFEGLHSCYFLNDIRLQARLKIVRTCNIEHDYYRYLAKACKGLTVKMFHFLEAWKFKRYQPALQSADVILPISQTDKESLAQAFPDKQIVFIPAFHANVEITSQEGQSSFILYHAKLSVHENEQVALFLIHEVFSKMDATCIIAGMNPSERLQKAVKNHPNIHLEANPDSGRMEYLMKEAHIHILPTFQPTGLKLKLLNSLFEGRHVVVNSLMLTGSGLDSLCYTANTPAAMIDICTYLLTVPFGKPDIQKRKQLLTPFYTSACQIERILRVIDFCSTDYFRS